MYLANLLPSVAPISNSSPEISKFTPDKTLVVSNFEVAKEVSYIACKSSS